MFAALWHILKWVADITWQVILWAHAHPVGAAIVGLSLQAAEVFLMGAEWAGSNYIAALLGWFGEGLLMLGIGAWLGEGITAWLGRRAAAVGSFIGEVASWWWWLSTYGMPGGIFW